MTFHEPMLDDADMPSGPHPHAENMKLYAEDAAKTAMPWRHWQFRTRGLPLHAAMWKHCATHPEWRKNADYRRKPQMVSFIGPGGTFEFPQPLQEAPTTDSNVYYPFTSDGIAACLGDVWQDSPFRGHTRLHRLLEARLLHSTPEAAKSHAWAWIMASGGSTENQPVNFDATR